MQEGVQEIEDVVDDEDAMPPLVPHGEEEDCEDEDEAAFPNCDEDNRSDQYSRSTNTNSICDAPLLVSEPGVSCSERANRAPERYNPSSGGGNMCKSVTISCHKYEKRKGVWNTRSQRQSL